MTLATVNTQPLFPARLRLGPRTYLESPQFGGYSGCCEVRGRAPDRDVLEDDVNATYSTRDEAVRSIIEAIEAGAARADEFDVEAIADEVLSWGHNTRGEFVATIDEDGFWAAVEANAR